MRAVAALLLCLLAAVGIYAAPSPQTSDTVVSLVTCYRGGDIYELEGHTALHIDMGPGRDVAVNWGVFDFDAPNFVYRFVKGETDYMAAAAPWAWFVESYRRQGRRVEEQRLLLTPEQTRRLVDMVAENLLPENRVYRYNYVKDNCSIRPLDIIRRAVAPDSIRLGYTEWDVTPMPYTFRDVMRRYHEGYPWYQFGIDLALGSGIDYQLEPAELAFVPLLLEKQIDGATVSGRHIAERPTVAVDIPADAAVAAPTPLLLRPVTVCWLVFALLLAFTVRDIRRRCVTRWVDAVYFGILGLLGLLLTFLIFVSVHEATSPNYLYLWLNPFCLIPVIFIWLKKCKKVVMSYQIINFALLFAGLLCWWWIPQSANAAFLPLVLGDMMRAASYVYINLRNRNK